MKTARIAYFSGTGNTKRAAGIVGAELEKSGWKVETIDIGSGGEPPRSSADDLLLLAFPALGFSPPSYMVAYAKRLPRASGTRAAVLCCVGSSWSKGGISPGWGGSATLTTLAILRARGYAPDASAEASYPANWTQAAEPPTGIQADAMLAHGDLQAKAFGLALARGEKPFVRRGIVTKTLMRLVSFVFRLFLRRGLARLYVADSSCTSCGLCARSCPVGAIAMRRGKPEWSLSCAICNRCINVCPSSSIQTSMARLILVAALNLAAMLAALPLATAFVRGGLPRLPGAAESIAIALCDLIFFAAFTALQLGPFDAVIRALERWPRSKKLFEASHTKGYARYLAPGFKPGANPYRD